MMKTTPRPEYSSNRSVYGLFVVAVVLLFVVCPMKSNAGLFDGNSPEHKDWLNRDSFDNEVSHILKEAESDTRIRLPEELSTANPWLKADIRETQYYSGLYWAKPEVCVRGTSPNSNKADDPDEVDKCYVFCRKVPEEIWKPTTFEGKFKCKKGAPLDFSIFWTSSQEDNADEPPKEIRFRRNAGNTREFSLEELVPYLHDGGKNRGMGSRIPHKWYGIRSTGSLPKKSRSLSKSLSKSGTNVLVLEKPDTGSPNSHEFLVRLDTSAVKKALRDQAKGDLFDTYQQSVVENNLQVFFNGNLVSRGTRSSYFSAFDIEKIYAEGIGQFFYKVKLTWVNAPKTELRVFGTSVECIYDKTCPSPPRSRYGPITVAEVRLLPLKIKSLPDAKQALSDWISESGILQYSQEAGNSHGKVHTLHAPLTRLDGDVVGAMAIDIRLAAGKKPRIKIPLRQEPDDLYLTVNWPDPTKRFGTAAIIEVAKGDLSITLQANKRPVVSNNPRQEPKRRSRATGVGGSSGTNSGAASQPPPMRELRVLLVPPTPLPQEVDIATFRRLVDGQRFRLKTSDGSAEPSMIDETFLAVRSDNFPDAVLLTSKLKVPKTSKELMLIPELSKWKAVNGNLRQQIGPNDPEVRFELIVPASTLEDPSPTTREVRVFLLPSPSQPNVDLDTFRRSVRGLKFQATTHDYPDETLEVVSSGGPDDAVSLTPTLNLTSASTELTLEPQPHGWRTSNPSLQKSIETGGSEIRFQLVIPDEVLRSEGSSEPVREVASESPSIRDSEPSTDLGKIVNRSNRLSSDDEKLIGKIMESIRDGSIIPNDISVNPDPDQLDAVIQPGKLFYGRVQPSDYAFGKGCNFVLRLTDRYGKDGMKPVSVRLLHAKEFLDDGREGGILLRAEKLFQRPAHLRDAIEEGTLETYLSISGGMDFNTGEPCPRKNNPIPTPTLSGQIFRGTYTVNHPRVLLGLLHPTPPPAGDLREALARIAGVTLSVLKDRYADETEDWDTADVFAPGHLNARGTDDWGRFDGADFRAAAVTGGYFEADAGSTPIRSGRGLSASRATIERAIPEYSGDIRVPVFRVMVSDYLALHGLPLPRSETDLSANSIPAARRSLIVVLARTEARELDCRAWSRFAEAVSAQVTMRVFLADSSSVGTGGEGPMELRVCEKNQAHEESDDAYWFDVRPFMGGGDEREEASRSLKRAMHARLIRHGR
uniref:Uncharacterized protein n=1 Tax=Candidatus Kentrum sp. FM TaxID=2126340 RepID=A0A450RZH8_9GAMM|nr:MAG: hypothetical protein BECKFM1743A_GA0114220_100199 [Candidatus Kentron sp. FM]VFJ45004.1 MAG: hypothetical protein BECKFM1743C_GA0114222_100199 [Candidatus Kentron sp. FM]VFK06631.1 MAG: hypothetical protein BECKFM1743B_GA0114221_100219 [Candidatus Kentron sp. FM]